MSKNRKKKKKRNVISNLKLNGKYTFLNTPIIFMFKSYLFTFLQCDPIKYLEKKKGQFTCCLVEVHQCNNLL